MDEEIYHLYHREEDDWWWSAGRRALVHRLWRRYAPTGGRPELLEVGCGTGGLLQDLARWSSVCGLDVSPEAVGYCRGRGLDGVCQGSLNALPYRDEAFDGIIAVDVLEHLDDDAGALREMLRVCRPGGRLVATVPAFSFLWTRRDEQLHHRRRYRLADFRRRVASAGFRVEKATYVNLPLFFPLLALVLIGRFRRAGHSLRTDYALVPGPLNRFLTGFVRIEAAYLARGWVPFGSSIACVARKEG